MLRHWIASDAIAAMLVYRNNSIFLIWELTSIFYANYENNLFCFVHQHGSNANHIWNSLNLKFKQERDRWIGIYPQLALIYCFCRWLDRENMGEKKPLFLQHVHNNVYKHKDDNGNSHYLQVGKKFW